MNKIKVLELFGGIGAPRKALLNLGYDVKSIDYVEIDEAAVKSYNALFEHLKKPESVVGYSLKPDILIHGSPCQDFSRAGKRLGGNEDDTTRSSLMWETVRIIDNLGQWKPDVVIWENVKGVLDKDNIHNFNKYLKAMEELGYTSNHQVLNSLDFGIPQSRNRVFVISCLDGSLFNFDNLKRKPLNNINKYLEQSVDDEWYYINQPSMIKAIDDNKIKPIITHTQTITTKQWRWNNAGYINTARGKRIITPLEAWRLMGFSDDDYNNVSSVVSRAEMYKQAGNSIVVDVLEAIFKELLEGK